MRLNRTFEWKVMTIWISGELPLFNFERVNILCAWIGPSSEKLWPFEFHESFRCSISSVSIYYVFESDLRVKSYDHLNFSRDLPLFNVERLDILCVWIWLPCEKLWPFEFLKSFRCSMSSISIYYAPESDLRVKCYDHLNFSRSSVVQFWASRYIMRLNRTSEWKVMTIWISRNLPLFNVYRLDILCAWIWPPSENLWPFEFLKSFRCSIACISICDAPESDLRVKTNDHLKCSRASVVQLRASRYILRLNRTSEWKVMTIWISRDVPLFNVERLDILCAWIWLPCEKLWPFEILKSFRCSMSSVSIYYATESDFRVKSYDHLNFSRSSVVQFWASRYIMRLNRTSE